MSAPLKRNRSERGAIVIQAAVCLLFLLAFASFVIDYGFMWSGRVQAQTAADAAALAGAYSLAFDGTTTANVRARARAVGRENYVWLERPDIQDTDIQIINCPPSGGALPASTTPECVKATAYRTNRYGRSNPMPTWFASLVGIANQGVVATATARAVSANGAACLKPWAVADKWLDSAGPWSQQSTWDPAAGDSYIPPTPTDRGTGFSATDASGNPDYYGYQIALKIDNPGGGSTPVYSGGWAMELALNNPSGGAPNSNQTYVNNITGCTSDVVGIAAPGTTCTAVDTVNGCLGVKTGSGGQTNSTAVNNYIAQHDPGASWQNAAGGDYRHGSIVNSAETTSSRIVPVAIVDLPQYIAQGLNGTNPVARVVNIVGFFLEGSCSGNFYKEAYLDCGSGPGQSTIVGRMVNYPGILVPSGTSVAGGFGEMLVLVR
jgi:hypothetical protein